MSRRKGARWVLWICGLSLCALWRPVRAGETIASGVQEVQAQLGDLEAAHNALDSAERGKVDPSQRVSGSVLEAHKELIDFEVDQQKKLVARERELQEVRGQLASLKADVEKLKTAAKQRDGELTERTKERASLEAKSREELASVRSQLDQLQASLAEERKEREKAQDEVKRLEAERAKLRAELGQLHNAAEEAAQKEEAVSQESGTGAKVSGIKKWRKPDGSLFFGKRPPPGSTLLGEVEDLGTSGGGDGRGETSPQ